MSDEVRELLHRAAPAPRQAPDIDRARREGARLRRRRTALRSAAGALAVAAVLGAASLLPVQQTVELSPADDAGLPEHPLFEGLTEDDRAAALATDDPVGLARDRARVVEAAGGIEVTLVPGWVTEAADPEHDGHVLRTRPDAVTGPGDPVVGATVERDGHHLAEFCCAPLPDPGEATLGFSLGGGIDTPTTGGAATHLDAVDVVLVGAGLERARLDGDEVPITHGTAVILDAPPGAALRLDGPAGRDAVVLPPAPEDDARPDAEG